MWKLLLLVLVAAGAFFAWKKFMSGSAEDDLLDDMYETAPPAETEQTAAAHPA